MALASLYEGTVIALDQIWGQKSRSALTILSILVGVAVVMAMSAVIVGVRSSIVDVIRGAGALNFDIRRYDDTQPRDGNLLGPAWGRNPPLTIQEARRLAALPLLEGAVPMVTSREAVSYRAQRVERAVLEGIGAHWERVFKASVVSGHDFLEPDVEAAHRVALITGKLATHLFGALDPLGQQIRIRGQPFEVIGTIQLPDNLMGRVADEMAVVPVTAIVKYWKVDRDFLRITASPAPGVHQQDAIDQVTGALRTMRRLRPGDPNTFAVVRADQMVKQFDGVTRIFFAVMIGLSSVALLVGGVGVVAIMMIAVTERTREIGIRMALGATRREILWQFLFEAMTVTLIGAALGMAVGGGVALTIDAMTPVAAQVPLFAVVAALGMAAVTGILFGLAPAWRAARMDPVEALRYE